MWKLDFLFFLYKLPDPLLSIIGRCTLYTPGYDLTLLNVKKKSNRFEAQTHSSYRSSCISSKSFNCFNSLNSLASSAKKNTVGCSKLREPVERLLFSYFYCAELFQSSPLAMDLFKYRESKKEIRIRFVNWNSIPHPFYLTRCDMSAYTSIPIIRQALFCPLFLQLQQLKQLLFYLLRDFEQTYL